MQLSRLIFETFVLALIGCLYLPVVWSANTAKREVRGTVYYTNNTPDTLNDFPVELLTTNQKTRVAKTTLNASGQFALSNIKPGKYLLRVHNLQQCALIYRIDVRQQSLLNVRIIMDADCAHNNGKISDLPK